MLNENRLTFEQLNQYLNTKNAKEVVDMKIDNLNARIASLDDDISKLTTWINDCKKKGWSVLEEVLTDNRDSFNRIKVGKAIQLASLKKSSAKYEMLLTQIEYQQVRKALEEIKQ